MLAEWRNSTQRKDRKNVADMLADWSNSANRLDRKINVAERSSDYLLWIYVLE